MKKHVSKSQYVCKVCKESFDSVSGMVAHRKGHSAEEYALVKAIKKPPKTIFECEYCKKVLASKTSLVAHLRIHTGEKPFECTICGKKLVFMLLFMFFLTAFLNLQIFTKTSFVVPQKIALQ
jgi:uncharacterized Zn-finger protein